MIQVVDPDSILKHSIRGYTCYDSSTGNVQCVGSEADTVADIVTALKELLVRNPAYTICLAVCEGTERTDENVLYGIMVEDCIITLIDVEKAAERVAEGNFIAMENEERLNSALSWAI